MTILKNIIYTLLYFLVIYYGGKGFLWLAEYYGLSLILIGAGILVLGMILLVGISVYKQIVK